MSTQKAPSKQLGSKLIFTAMQILKERGEEMLGRDVIQAVGQRVVLDEWARQSYEKSGGIRWISILQFFTIAPQKAGYLVKKKKYWRITPEGAEAIAQGEDQFFELLHDAYMQWQALNPKQRTPAVSAPLQNEIEQQEDFVEDEIENAPELTIERAEEIAADGLQEQIRSLNPYKFQDFVAALLKAMGYFIAFNAPRGKDGGVDVIAYQDPLGINTPRIKVQCKHRQNSASVDEIRQLMGLLHDGDVGIFVSSGGFTSDSKSTARSSAKHVELIDLDRLIDLWIELYPKLTDEDKDLLRLKPVYFYEPPNI